MKLTKNTNKVRVTHSQFYRDEVWIQTEDKQHWYEETSKIKMPCSSFQKRLNRDDKAGYQIYNISEDDE